MRLLIAYGVCKGNVQLSYCHVSTYLHAVYSIIASSNSLWQYHIWHKPQGV